MGEDSLRGKKVWARRPFLYAGQELAQGEIFTLGGHLNDEILVRLRFVEEVPKFKKFHEHGATGRQFIEGGYLEAFGRAERKRQEELHIVSAGEGLYGLVDSTGDAEARRLAEEAPLDLSKAKGPSA
jgi:hypothetical protein